MSDSRKRWPSVALSVPDVFRFLGMKTTVRSFNPSLQLLEVDCPNCKRNQCSGLIDDRDGLDLNCHNCHWEGDVFQYTLAHASKAGETPTYLSILGLLRRNNIRGARKITRQALAAYTEHTTALRDLRDFIRVVDSRQTTRLEGPVPTCLGINDQPFRQGEWYCSTVDEVARYTDKCRPKSLIHKRLGLETDELSGLHPAVVIPLYDHRSRVVGVWAAARTNQSGTRAEWYLRLCPGAHCYTGLNRVYSSPDQKYHIIHITDAPSLSVQLRAAIFRTGSDLLRITVVPRGQMTYDTAAAISRNLHHSLRYFIWSDEYRSYTRDEIILSRVIGAPIYTGPLPNLDPADVAHAFVQFSQPWESLLETAANRDSPVYIRDAVGQIGKWEDLRPLVVNKWSESVMTKVDSAFDQPQTHIRVMEFAGKTIAETDAGWIDVNTNRVYADAIPIGVLVSRLADGRTLYSGSIRFGHKLYPFRSTRFRRNAAAVVESVLLKNRVTSPPAIHPLVSKSMAEIALYFSARKY